MPQATELIRRGAEALHASAFTGAIATVIVALVARAILAWARQRALSRDRAGSVSSDLAGPPPAAGGAFGVLEALFVFAAVWQGASELAGLWLAARAILVTALWWRVAEPAAPADTDPEDLADRRHALGPA